MKNYWRSFENISRFSGLILDSTRVKPPSNQCYWYLFENRKFCRLYTAVTVAKGPWHPSWSNTRLTINTEVLSSLWNFSDFNVPVCITSC